MSYTYDFNLLVSKDKIQENLVKLLSSENETFSLGKLLIKTNQLRDRPKLLDFCANSEVEYSWQKSTLYDSMLAPSFDEVLAGIKEKGVFDYLTSAPIQIKSALDEIGEYIIECVLSFKFSDNSRYEVTICICFDIRSQCLYGDIKSDINLYLITTTHNWEGGFHFKNDIDFISSKVEKALFMHVVEILDVKYAWFESELTTNHIGNIDVNGLSLPSINKLKPWERHDSSYNLNPVMVFGKALVEVFRLDQIDWGEENIYYLKWLRNDILWLNSPRDLVNSSKYQVPDEQYKEDLNHYESLLKVLPDTILEYNNIRKLILNDNGNFSYKYDKS